MTELPITFSDFIPLHPPIHLSGCLLHKALVRHSEGLAQRLCGVVLEHLLVHQVYMEVDGSVDGGIHPSVAIEDCKVGLFLLVLPKEAQ